MSNRERVEALLNRETPDRVPIYPFGGSFSMSYRGRSLADLFINPEISLDAQSETAKDFDWVLIPDMSYAAFGGWEFGGELKWPDKEFDQAPAVTRYPASTVEEVMNLKIPDISKAGIIPLQKQFFDLSLQKSAENKPWDVVVQMEGTFTLASNIVGTDLFMRWVIKNPEIVHRLMRLASDFEIEMAKYWRDIYGTEGVLLWGGEPGGFMFAPGCELPPMAPVDNVRAMTKAVNDFGHY